MSRGAILDERSKRALQKAREDGMPTATEMAAQMGIELSDSEEEEPHWAELPAPDEGEPLRVAVARSLFQAGFKILGVVDVVGGWLAYQFGITTPKYQYAIDELASIQEEIEREKNADREAMDEIRREADEIEAKMESGESIQSQPGFNRKKIEAESDV
eukprot:m.338259 g.338259  ORF g.338259 m.338259 type:complete len:159 (-) comp18357_c0_seq1:97-573(-)